MSVPIVTPFDPAKAASSLITPTSLPHWITSEPGTLLPSGITNDFQTPLTPITRDLPLPLPQTYTLPTTSSATSFPPLRPQTSSWTTSYTSNSTTLGPTTSWNTFQSSNTDNKSISAGTGSFSTDHASLNPGIVAGIIISGIIFLVLLAGCMFYLGQRYRRKSPDDKSKSGEVEEKGFKQELDGYAMHYDSKSRRNRAIIVTEMTVELPGDFGLAKELPDDEKFKHAVYLRELPADEKEKAKVDVKNS